MRNSSLPRKSNLGAFRLSCWLLGLVAFVQLMSVGLALSMRSQKRPEPVIVERLVPQYVAQPQRRAEPVNVVVSAQDPVVDEEPEPEPELRSEPDEVADAEKIRKLPQSRRLNEPPPILDPVIKKLLEEARDARISGDLYAAHNKLKEAELHDPENSNVIYGLGLNYEAFGNYGKASEYFFQVWKAGPRKSQSLYLKAGIKVSQGLEPDPDGLAALGWCKMANPKRDRDGEIRTLILPVEVAANRDFDPNLINSHVTFYEKIDGAIEAVAPSPGDSGFSWASGTADWSDGEEIAEVWYRVRNQDAATSLLSGEREYYGFVAELYYNKKLVDVRAHPRTLHQNGGVSSPDELQRVSDHLDYLLDGLTVEDLAEGGSFEGPSVLPKLPGAQEEEPSPEDFGLPANFGVPVDDVPEHPVMDNLGLPLEDE